LGGAHASRCIERVFLTEKEHLEQINAYIAHWYYGFSLSFLQREIHDIGRIASDCIFQLKQQLFDADASKRQHARLRIYFYISEYVDH